MSSSPGGHRKGSSTSGEAILAAFVPTATTALIYLAVFYVIRNRYPKIYAPRTFLATVPEKDRTPAHRATGRGWIQDFRRLPTRFVLLHNSLDAYLYLRFLQFAIAICFVGSCITFPILIPLNARGGGSATQLDKITFSNIANNNYLWAHTAVAWVFFGGIFALIARERLLLIGTRQAYYLRESYARKLSSRTVLFLNAPHDVVLPENLQKYFGSHAERSWPVKDTGDLENLVQARNSAAYKLEKSEVELLTKASKNQARQQSVADGVDQAENGTNGATPLVPKSQRPSTRNPLLIGSRKDAITQSRENVAHLASKIEDHRAAPSRNIPEQSAVFVAFSNQAAAHRAFQQISFKSRPVPIEDRYLAMQPKEVIWKNLALPLKVRVSKASSALAFVIVFTIFFSIPVGLIGTLSNVEYLADRVKFLGFVKDLPPVVLGLLTGLLPPYLVSYFVSYVPKLFRHIAKQSGEPTNSQAELKTQAWYFVFQVIQVFLITTFSSGAAAVISQIIQDPASAPVLIAEGLPKASNFYLTYFILQGTTSVASNALNYSDLFSYLFYQSYLNKTPREKFNEYAKMKGLSWGALYPKFTNLLVIAIAYSCIAPLVTGFATAGLALYYVSYRYNLLYVCQTKIDTKGEAYKRALQHMTTGIYIGLLCLIGLFSAREAGAQTALIVMLLVLTAVGNLVLDRTLRPLELYLGKDSWQELEVPLLANEDGIDEEDEEALHISSHNRRLGLTKLPSPTASWLSAFFDSIIGSSRSQVGAWLRSPDAERSEDDDGELGEEELEKAYVDPAFTSKTPKLWIPKDGGGVSKEEIGRNEEVGIQATDQGAEVDEQGRLIWTREFEECPVWKKPRSI